MNYIRHLTAFFDRVALDERLHPTHISLYMALFQYWNYNRFQNPISISRSEMMAVSKIQAKATYHKVIKELHEFGLIIYRPSYNPFRGSEVELVQWIAKPTENLINEQTSRGSENEQAVNGYHTKINTATIPLNEPPYKHINTTNIDCSTSSNFNHVNGKGRKAEVEKKITQGGRPASLEEVKQFFIAEKFETQEAQKFYNYFQSNGWKVGGRAPMKDWHAAARNWILNSATFKTKQKSPALHTTTIKDYGEPL